MDECINFFYFIIYSFDCLLLTPVRDSIKFLFTLMTIWSIILRLVLTKDFLILIISSGRGRT